MARPPLEVPRLDGRRIVVTGASTGLGRVVADRLARAGAELIVVAHDPERLEAALGPWKAAGLRVSSRLCDLADTASARALGTELAAEWPRIDALVNNAGGIFFDYSETPSGDERTFGVNVLAPFLLTELLLPSLAASGAGRVVNVSSAAHRTGRIELDHIDRKEKYRGWSAYSQSKLALLLLTREAARRHAGMPVTFNACHPGFVRSRFGHTGSGGMASLIQFFQRFAAISPERGAETPLYLATSPDVAGLTGEYFAKCRPRASSAASQDREMAARLWELCRQRSGLGDASGR